LLHDAGDLALPRVPILLEQAIVKVDVASPVLSINHDHAARSHQKMVQISFGPSWPADVMECHPALQLQLIENSRNPGFALGAGRPRPLSPLRVV
jgi:hypothetical protein